MDKQIEMAQLLARFKLQVKRSLGQTVDLEGLTRDPAYARQRLLEIEEAALDEALLIMVLRLRDLLLPAPQPMAASAVAEPPAPKAARTYLMGARSW